MAEFFSRNDQIIEEVEGVKLLLHGSYELTWDFTGCEEIRGIVSGYLKRLHDLQDKNDVKKLVEEKHKDLKSVESNFVSDVTNKNYEKAGTDTGKIFKTLGA